VLCVMGCRVVCVLLLALLARMRLLCGIIDIVVPYSVVARQRASDTWVPPERTALDGRRTLNGKNLMRRGPPGRLRGERGLMLLNERRCGVGCAWNARLSRTLQPTYIEGVVLNL